MQGLNCVPSAKAEASVGGGAHCRRRLGAQHLGSASLLRQFVAAFPCWASGCLFLGGFLWAVSHDLSLIRSSRKCIFLASLPSCKQFFFFFFAVVVFTLLLGCKVKPISYRHDLLACSRRSWRLRKSTELLHLNRGAFTAPHKEFTPFELYHFFFFTRFSAVDQHQLKSNCEVEEKGCMFFFFFF